MRVRRSLVLAMSAVMSAACTSRAQEAGSLVRSTDPELRRLADALIGDLAERSGLELKGPVVLERRSRSQLVHYLEVKLDEELPVDEAEAMTHAYALFGLVPPATDLRRLLLDLYTEQVAGFYDPDSTALFVLDDQPPQLVEGLLIHELVHALQDQSADLSAITADSLGNDRRLAAQSAIEGHATLVMLDYLAERMSGQRLDLTSLPDFAGPALQQAVSGMAQYPSLAGAPAVIQQELLFPYIGGTQYVLDLWRTSGRVAPFGDRLPMSTEQVMTQVLSDAPLRIELGVQGGTVVWEENLGRMEVGVLLEAHLGGGSGELSSGWGGDRYALVDRDGTLGLAWLSIWDDDASRDRFVSRLSARLLSFAQPATLEAKEVDGRPGALLLVGLPDAVRVSGSVIG